MRLLVNGCSANHMSARHVLLGHLRQLPRHWDVTVVTPNEVTEEPWNSIGARLVKSPRVTQTWLGRAAWERLEIPRLARQHRAELIFSPNGMVLKRCPIPQATLAQNPWCMTPILHHSFKQRQIAKLQRSQYRFAHLNAALVVFNSQHMQGKYRKNAGGQTERKAAIAYQGINDDRFENVQCLRGGERSPLTIVSVSAMASWKGAERMVEVLAEIRKRGVDAKLRLVGPWPDQVYRQVVLKTIGSLRLERHVTITGRVSDQQLDEELASAKVYALLSRCESFGIPAVEAQAFGTPVVGSLGTAMPEVGGQGGVFVEPDDIDRASTEIVELLTNESKWELYSKLARENVERFRWSVCSQPLIDSLESVA